MRLRTCCPVDAPAAGVEQEVEGVGMVVHTETHEKLISPDHTNTPKKAGPRNNAGLSFYK